MLCEYLEHNRQFVEGRTVMELGAGSGIVGIIAAYLGECPMQLYYPNNYYAYEVMISINNYF